jgi:6-pyruvoyltetrahydropterin/6-carboxytetrahydropterin synthase
MIQLNSLLPPLLLLITTFAKVSDASLFGTTPRTTPSSSYYHTSHILQLRGGGDDDAPAFRPYLPHTLTIRDSLMIAHSFHSHPSFGPAGGLHGATYTVDVEFASSTLHKECNWVIDIGVASAMVAEVLTEYNYKNLDEVFGDNVMTTTEFMCRAIFDGVVKKLKERYSDIDVDHFEGWIKVTLWESHKAWGSFEGPCL